MTQFRETISGHWKAFSLIVVAVSALVTGAYAHWKNSTPSTPSLVTSTATSYPLELSVRLNKTGFQQGELIQVHAHLKNISNRTVQLTASEGYFDFKITDENDTIFYRWSRYYSQFIPMRPYTLKPCAQLNYTQESWMFDNKTVSMVSLQLSKGTYKFIEFTVPMEVAYLEPLELIGAGVVLETPPITITIT